MIDERTRLMMETYIPRPRDPDLPPGAYYWMQNNKVIKVWPLDIYPHKDGVEYGIYQEKGGRLVRLDVGYADGTRGVRMCDLYDNKEDCRERTHGFCEDWERLRKLQTEGN